VVRGVGWRRRRWDGEGKGIREKRDRIIHELEDGRLRGIAFQRSHGDEEGIYNDLWG
jgi:hypothetical protein